MKVKLIIISIILLLVMVFASGCIPVLEKLGLVSPTGEEQLTPEKGGPPDGLVKVLIGFKEKPGAAQQAIVKGVGGKIKYTYHIVDAIAASIPQKAIDALQNNPNVKYVEPDVEIFAVDQTLPWGVNRIDAEVVWTDYGYTGQGVDVAIIDSGIDNDHPDLIVERGENFVSIPSWKTPDPDKWDDDYGHGTHVAGIVAALDNAIGVVGVAPEADLYALKVLDKTGRGNYGDVIAAIEWCVREGIQVTNNSYGSSGYPGETVENAFDNSAAAGVLHVAAAGNNNGGDVIYPASFSSVIAVSATDEGDNLADFSSIGIEVELAAPGVDIYSTYKDGGYTTYSGTSMASPHVAGVAALVIAAGISDVRTKLQDTAENLGAEGRDSQFGYGLVDAAEAASEPVVVHDVAITVISAPSWVLQGEMVSVDVDVDNEGTFEETFDVVLTESPDGFSETKTINLAVGVSTTVSFSWQTSTLGDHTLTATAGTVMGETDTADNFKSTVITVKEPIHDIAVLTMNTPSPVYQGEMVSVDVDVANEGTFEETFDVVLTESPDGFSETKTINLAVGVSTTVSFSWQTSTLGDHTLTATAGTVMGETDTADNFKSTIVTVEKAVANTMYVERIGFSPKVAGPNKFLYITVKVVDGSDQPLGGVRVEMTLSHESAGTWNFAGDTDVDGMVKFTQKKAPSGSYTATVTGLTLSGYDWNEGPVESDIYILE